MFPKCRELAIEGGTFNEAQTQYFNYNITVVRDNRTQTMEDHENIVALVSVERPKKAASNYIFEGRFLLAVVIGCALIWMLRV
ncbi:hypothetical protein M413DRAFT_440726 [Hebeloma cylindrosporum]|uniref:Uncharacterized protein n=1 Tax=Hebeloma cylindrosporum TaxID=76867 RepID=A0A0C3CT47_HEBCY|nr:hypothetical protein M413DRAFT_440726 [Hebeloma cylindrosporum h7]